MVTKHIAKFELSNVPFTVTEAQKEGARDQDHTLQI